MLPDQGKEMGGRGIAFSRANLDIRQAVEDIATVYKNLKGGGELLKNIPVQMKSLAFGTSTLGGLVFTYISRMGPIVKTEMNRN